MSINDQQLLNLCQNLTALRLAHHFTPTEMAGILEISAASLKRLEAGEVPPRIGVDFLIQGARHFHVTTASLFSSPDDFIIPPAP